MRRFLIVATFVLMIAAISQAGYYIRTSSGWKYTTKYVPGARPEKIFKAMLDTSVPRIRADKVWNISYGGSNLTGEGVVVCVLDTGVNFSTPGLQGANATPFSVVCTSGTCITTPNMDTDDSYDPNTGEVVAHGTNVAGIIASRDSTYKGVAPGAKIISVKVLNSTGEANETWVVAGINWCIDNRTTYNISIISMSLGTYNYHSSSYCDGADAVVEAANNATRNGMIVVAAAGNEGNKTGISSPACGSNVTSVGAFNESSGSVWDFSNYASILDLIAPGVGITTWLNSTHLITETGTSQATPHVSGVIALLLQIRNLTWSEAESVLKSTAENISDPYQGAGLVDAYAAAMSLLQNFTISNTTHIVKEDSVTTALINITNPGLEERVNVSISNLTNSFGEALNATLSNGTHSGSRVTLLIPKNSTKQVSLIINSSYRPGEYEGVLNVTGQYSNSSANLTVHIYGIAHPGREFEVNMTGNETLYLEIPDGLKNLTIYNTTAASNISMSVTDPALIYDGSLSSMQGNQTSGSLLRLIFYNSSSQYDPLFNISVNFSRFMISSSPVRTSDSSAEVVVTFSPANETKNLSIESAEVYNDTSVQPGMVYVERITLEYKGIVVNPSSSWTSAIYIPANASSPLTSIVRVNLTRNSTEETRVDFCDVSPLNAYAYFNAWNNLTGCNYGSTNMFVLSNNGTKPQEYNLTIRIEYPDDTRIGDFIDELKNITITYNVSGQGNGTYFNLTLVANDTKSGRTVIYRSPVSFLPEITTPDRNHGNISVTHYFNLYWNSTLRINITNPSIKPLNLSYHGAKCFLSSPSFFRVSGNSTNQSDNLTINEVSIGSCNIGPGGWTILNISLATNNNPGRQYVGWVYMNTSDAYPEKFMNITIYINITDRLNVTANSTSTLFNPSDMVTTNMTLRYMDGNKIGSATQDNITVRLEGPNGEVLNRTFMSGKYNYSGAAEELNISLPGMVGGNWTAKISANVSNNTGDAQFVIRVNNSNIDISIKGASSVDSGEKATFTINVSNYGTVDDNVTLNITGCGVSKLQNVTVKANSYNDSVKVTTPPLSSGCTLSVNASDGHFWVDSSKRDVSSKTFSSSVSVVQTTTTTTTTTVPTTAAVQQQSPATNQTQANQTSEAKEEPECSYNLSIISVPDEIDMNGTAEVVIKNTGTCEQEARVDVMSDYFQTFTLRKNISAGEVEVFSVQLSLEGLESGKYAAVIRVSATGFVRSYSAIAVVPPGKEEIERIISRYEELRKIAEERGISEAEPVVKKIGEEIERGNYVEARSLLSQLEEMVSKSEIREQEKGRPGIIYIVVAVLFIAAVLISMKMASAKKPDIWRPSEKKYEFRKGGLRDMIRELLGK